jgi:3-hydroxybutyrate dehydrogenase
MSNKIAMVTGATSGIGLGIATELAQSGTHLIINGFGTKSEIQNVIEQLEKYQIKCLYHNCNLASPVEIEQMYQESLKMFDKVDILVNNAGIQYVAKIEDFPAEKLESIIRVDLLAAFYTTKLVVPLMKQNKWGRIINIASAHGLVASPFKSAYVAAKHGIVGLTKSVALELAPFGITVNSICPGYVKTNLVMNQIADTAKVRNISENDVMEDVILKPHAIKNLIEIQEVANLVNFLCQDKAKSITGSAITIDAGWTAQ